ncbi:NAD-dependent epimerase/dehydratase family protein [Hoeflea poritis]|uniref:NAD(P)-dependent oxidoreductase n=1 Tax=Hoeflea poritis TaxID=2993659 RepID=A0ABT4VT66_9HYPH|nr:NAD(P)-dependent oxidoreductase [Hoeflea poritis]MDA4847906.1 NAD(P)-dependent oxidoreductase [Hoeflea poritis]
MTHVLVTGGSGTVGRFIVDDLLEHGYEVTIAGRNAPEPDVFRAPVRFIPLSLDPKAHFSQVLAGCDMLVHAAFSHEKGRYRGGEGDDVPGFWRSNFLATLLLFNTAAQAGIKRGVFLSSRAAYGRQAPGARLVEAMPSHPDTHYGAVKLACERHLRKLNRESGLVVASLRITGVYGSSALGAAHKWQSLFANYLDGRPVEPRCGTEVHGRDVASAVRQVLEADEIEVAGKVFNVSDLLVDHHDLLEIVAANTGCNNPLPAKADSASCNVMDTTRLRRLGWRPGGVDLLKSEVARLVEN